MGFHQCDLGIGASHFFRGGALVTDDKTIKINSAVDECLGLCTSSRAPQLDLRVFVDERLRKGVLTPEEAQLVESTVRRILFERSRS